MLLIPLIPVGAGLRRRREKVGKRLQTRDIFRHGALLLAFIGRWNSLAGTHRRTTVEERHTEEADHEEGEESFHKNTHNGSILILGRPTTGELILVIVCHHKDF